MFVMDVPPDVPPQYAPIVVAEAAQTKKQTMERTIGVCHLIESRLESRESAVNHLAPFGEATVYLEKIEGVKFDWKSTTWEMTLLEPPKHGELDTGTRGAQYYATPNYEGDDQATFLVEIGGYKVKVIYFFRVMPFVGEGSEQGSPEDDKSLCPNGRVWKISLNPDDPNAPIYTFSHPSELTSPYAGLSNVNLTFGTLVPGALGQTTGDTITLDPNAAGFGWFIDTTPLDNSEFLPTHDPDVWVAREGSDAAGRMDLLSVLLHEYGHVLGIDHSADHSDYMATTLTPGQRRLPSAEELSLMAQLVGELRSSLGGAGPTLQTDNSSNNGPLPFPWLPLDSTLGLAFLGRLRSRLGESSSPSPDYLVVANPTLLNGNLDLPQGWLTEGNVEFANGAAVLRETATSQTRLSQAFVVGANDRYLSFTLGDSALDDQSFGPDDAFEVALVDANTGASLASALNLTRTDALLNRQASGLERLSQGITRTVNAAVRPTLWISPASPPAPAST